MLASLSTKTYFLALSIIRQVLPIGYLRPSQHLLGILGGNFIEHVQINCHGPASCPIRTFLPVRGVWGPSLIGWWTGKLLPGLPVLSCDWLTTTGRGGTPPHTQWRDDSCSFLSLLSALKIFCCCS